VGRIYNRIGPRVLAITSSVIVSSAL
jgi:hypothetical protein